jgi:hypothetical protein
MQFLRKFYGFLLHLFPRAYRAEYGEELQTVFNLLLADAAQVGGMDILWMLVRELLALPEAAFHEHLRERRVARMAGTFAPRVDFLSGSRAETLAAFVPFIVTFGVFYLASFLPLQDMPFWVGGVVRLSVLVSIFVTFVVGLSKRLPRWFMPYLGFVLSIVNIFVTNGLIDPKWRGFSFPAYMPGFARDFIQGGVFWVGIIILVFLVVVLATLIPTFRPFYGRLRNDWTLLAFILYGIAPFAVWLTFDDYYHAGLYLFVSFLMLAIGGWLYLRSSVAWKKFMFLFTGLTLAMAVTVLGAAVLIEDSVYIYSTWQTEMVQAIMTWMYLVIFMCLPLALNLLPRANVPPQAAEAIRQ